MTVKRISFSGVSWSWTFRDELVMTTPEFSSTWMLLTDTTGSLSSLLCRERKTHSPVTKTMISEILCPFSDLFSDEVLYFKNAFPHPN